MAFKTFDNFAIVLTPGYNEPLNDVDIQLLKSLITKDRNELHITENEGIGYKHSLDILYEIDNIKTLMLNNYNKKITKLPKNLVNFYTGNAFNQSINNLVLPDSIEKLVLGSNFNRIIEKFPSNLRYLEFGRRFNKPLTNLPDGLKSLYLNGEFNYPLDNLPKSLRFLSLFGIYNNRFNYSLDNLPEELEELYLSGPFNHPIDFLPSNLKMIYINSDFNHQIDNLPIGLLKICFANNAIFNHSIDKLPDSIEEIRLPKDYSYPIKKLPNNLKSLEISYKYIYLSNLRSILPKEKINLI